MSDEPVRLGTRPYFTRALSSSAASRLESFRDQTAFETAYLVPIAYAGEWHARGFSSLITNPPPPPREGDTINSAGHELIYFKPDLLGLAGTALDQQLLDNRRRPPEALFNRHFEQAILCNVRGTGEPHLEFDFPPGSDMVGEILAAPRAVQRMEFELFTRLGGSEAPQDND
ncbi:hypothetical protein Sste5346_000167 [Sporothrix stenoceras]|uniref:Uncharacterized protein n=1 Tax=Sporothrix stenoceras TaxID=5173 RepID=A0ABR3ZTW2_9PEZI